MTYFNYVGVAIDESATPTSSVFGTSAGNETLTAPAGPSLVDGNGGGDLLIGSNGDNIFNVKDLHDAVQVGSGLSGIKTVVAYNSFSLPANVQDLTVHGDFNYAVGNNLDNLIIVDGNQWVDGGPGNDVLVGSTTQRTTFVETAGDGNDVIYNWNGNSQLQLNGYGLNTPAQIRSAMSQVGADVLIKLSSTESLTIRSTTPTSFVDRQFLTPLDTSKLGAMTFDDEFNTLNLVNPATGIGVWETNFGGNLKDQQAYTLTANGEQEAYVAPGFQGQGTGDLGINPFSVSNGVLTITAEQAPAADLHATYGLAYTSGMLNTLDTFQQKYGYFEIRAQVPQAVGAWPAFWMLPHPYQPNMEGDIFEALGATPNVDYRRAFGGSDTIYDNALKLNPTGFHTYGMLWTPTTVSFYLDGVEVLSGNTPATWTSPMALILNMAVGGFGGTPNAAQFPAAMQVDYVHAYALADGSSIVQHTAPTAPVATLHDDGSASGQVSTPELFADGSGPVTSAEVLAMASKPTTLPAGKSFITYEDSGAVFGAVSDGHTLGSPTGLGAFTTNPFTGAGTWLTDGKVVAGYLQANASGGEDAWDVVFDPSKLTFVRQDLGPATGNLHFVATQTGGFAVSWHAPDGTVEARGYDEYAYGGDVPGWYGPVSHITGDIIGVTADSHVIAQNGATQELYDLMNATVTPPPGSPPPATGGQVLTGGAADDTLIGGAGDDTITGGSASNYLRGGPGNDVIFGGPRFNDMNGNQGNDTIHGGSGDNWVVGGQGSDLLFGGGGTNLILGNLGDDTLHAGAGNDVLRGGKGNDVLFGGPGADFLSGDLGNNTETGGTGADIFHTFGAVGLDLVTNFNEAKGDRVEVDPGTAYTVSQVGADTVIDMTGGGKMILQGVAMASLHPGWIFGA